MVARFDFAQHQRPICDQTKKLKEDAKKKAAAVKKAEAQLKKMAAAEEKLAVMKAKALAASKALNAHEKEAGVRHPAQRHFCHDADTRTGTHTGDQEKQQEIC